MKITREHRDTLAAVGANRARYEDNLSTLLAQRSKAAKSEDRKTLSRVTADINTERGLIEDADLEQARLRPLAAAEAQAEIDEQNDAERHAIVAEVSKGDGTKQDELADALVALVAANVAQAAPLGSRFVALNAKLLADHDHKRRETNAAGLPHARGRSGFQAQALAAFIYRLVEAAGRPAGIDDLISFSVATNTTMTFAEAAKLDAERVAHLLRVEVKS